MIDIVSMFVNVVGISGIRNFDVSRIILEKWGVC